MGEGWSRLLLLWGPLLLMLLVPGAAVCLGTSVYSDARLRRNGSAVMWGILSGFFWAAAVVYLWVRSADKPRSCPRCRRVNPAGLSVCPACGLPLASRWEGTAQQQRRWRKRRTRFLVLFVLLCLAAGLVLSGAYACAFRTGRP